MGVGGSGRRATGMGGSGLPLHSGSDRERFGRTTPALRFQRRGLSAPHRTLLTTSIVQLKDAHEERGSERGKKPLGFVPLGLGVCFSAARHFHGFGPVMATAAAMDTPLCIAAVVASWRHSCAAPILCRSSPAPVVPTPPSSSLAS